MVTINTILEEVKNVPVNRLEELYSIIRSLKDSTGGPGAGKGTILTFAGCFNGMKQENYDDLINNMKETRNNFLDRETDI